MMTLRQYPADGIHYQTCAMAEEMLRREGWHHFHAGNWRNPAKPGLTRDIRKQPQGFIVYETSPTN